jgi:hypothetical protein
MSYTFNQIHNIEKTLMTNYFGPYLLTILLLESSTQEEK